MRGIESDGHDLGGLTAEMYATFWREVLDAGAAPHLKQINVHKTSITEVSRRQLAGLKLLRKGLSVLVDDEDKNCLLSREL